MSNESEKTEERRNSSSGGTTTTEKGSIDEPVSPTPLPLVRAPGEKDEDGAPLNLVRSVASSTRPRITTPVPKESRRGLLPWLSLVPEIDNPRHYPNGVKWVLTLFVAVAASAAPMGSAILYPSLEEISAELQVTATVVNLSVAVYLIAMSVFPLWWSSFSETLGRRSIYLASFALNVAFSAASGGSQNIGQLIVFRTFAGGAAASVQAVGAGTIADLWEPRERGRAMGFFYLGPLMGPLLAPIIGGALTSGYGWRSTMYFLAVYGAVIFGLILFGIPETLPRSLQEQKFAAAASSSSSSSSASGPEDANATAALSRVVSTRRSVVRARTKTAGLWLKRVFVDPLSILAFLRFPAVALTVSFAAVTFCSLYVLNICVQSAYAAPPYSFSPLIVGVLYVPSSLGYFIASLLGGPWLDRIMERSARRAGRYDARGRLIFYPEDRVRENAWLSSTMYPGALVWFGWTIQTHQHWAVPLVANFFFGVGSMLVFSMATTMLTEFMPKRASSGVALNNFVRNILAAAGTVATRPLIDVIGYGWLATAVALVSWVGGSIALFFLRRNSQKWREGMNEQMS